MNSEYTSQAGTITTQETKKVSGGSNGQTTVISDPTEIMNIVLWHIDAVNDRKSELTTATKSLTDLVKQLLRVYGEHIDIIRQLQARINELEQAHSQLAKKSNDA